MKIEIELKNNQRQLGKHLQMISEYLTSKIEYTEKQGLFGISYYDASLPEIGGKTDGIEWGENIGTHNDRVFVHCRKTKGGTYKVKVWGN